MEQSSKPICSFVEACPIAREGIEPSTLNFKLNAIPTMQTSWRFIDCHFDAAGAFVFKFYSNFGLMRVDAIVLLYLYEFPLFILYSYPE
jgi:hypothetical protein